MVFNKYLTVNSKGHLCFEGCDTTKLAEKYGTPLYVMSETTIRDNCRMFTKAFDGYSGGGMPLFASKSFMCLEMCRIAAQEGLGLDVVSGGELFTAIKAGFPMERVYFHGNNKTEQELKMALLNDVHCIVLDNIEELNMLSELASDEGKIAKVSFRIKPGVDAHTHEFIRTGQIDSKFGFALETGEAFDAVKTALGLNNIEIIGFHCHIGSQIFDTAPFELAAEKMLNFIHEVNSKLGIDVKVLNLGGGFAIKYTESDPDFMYDSFVRKILGRIEQYCKENDMNCPQVLIEPGRSITGAAGITLYTVGSVKNIPGIRNYVSIDGGMCDNPRYILYKADYTACIASKADKPKDFKATIAGRCCETGDLIQENAMLQSMERGDILAVFSTGAYNFSMAMTYNRLPRPAVVMVKDEKSRIIVERQTYMQLIQNDI